MNKLSLFIPVYNEARILEKHISLIHHYLSKKFEQFEIIIVDDNSTDDTLKIASNIKYKEVSTINFNKGPSRRENLGIAMRKAKFSVVAFIDMDLATNINYLEKLFIIIMNDADIAIGSRYKTIKPKRTLFRKTISKSYNFFLQFYFNSKIYDHQCGFKAFKKDHLNKLLDELGYDSSFKRGWFWDAELLIRAQKNGFKIKELPVKWTSGKQSSFKISREMKMIPYVFMLRFRL